MATYSNNTTIKISAAISFSATVTGANVTLYTAPANAYAEVQIWQSTGTARVISIGGVNAFSGFTDSTVSAVVGPGQSVVAVGGAGSQPVAISGVQFLNTP